MANSDTSRSELKFVPINKCGSDSNLLYRQIIFNRFKDVLVFIQINLFLQQKNSDKCKLTCSFFHYNHTVPATNERHKLKRITKRDLLLQAKQDKHGSIFFLIFFCLSHLRIEVLLLLHNVLPLTQNTCHVFVSNIQECDYIPNAVKLSIWKWRHLIGLRKLF